MTTQRQLSDIAIDSALISSTAISAAVGLYALSPVFFATMAGLAIARRYWPEFRTVSATAMPAIERINGSRIGSLWAEYVNLKQQAAAEKKANFGGTLKRAWLLYGLWLGAAAYWTMPFILAFAGQMLSAQYLVILLLVVLHHLSIFAQYAEIRAWARKRDQKSLQPT